MTTKEDPAAPMLSDFGLTTYNLQSNLLEVSLQKAALLQLGML